MFLTEETFDEWSMDDSFQFWATYNLSRAPFLTRAVVSLFSMRLLARALGASGGFVCVVVFVSFVVFCYKKHFFGFLLFFAVS